MINQRLTTKELLKIRRKIKTENPLIHCITNPISINDCANIVLAVGGKPIMAEHPLEVAEITETAGALGVNLGNITDNRMESMLIAGKTAFEKDIPQVIDLVGVGCSKLRLNYARKFIKECRPNVIKGNISEIKAIAGIENKAQGIDAGKEDIIREGNYGEIIEVLKKLSLETGAIIVVTGIVDIIVDKDQACLIRNGSEMLSMITGTGCMVNALIASYISSGDLLAGSILAVALMGICGELSEQAKGTGSFRTELIDNMFNITDEKIVERIRYKLKG